VRYGVRDYVLRDPAGNLVRINELPTKPLRGTA
jgi:hypothetical protein